jgi:hypothetical protein
MFFVREIPVVIEPGVSVLESEITVEDAKAGERNVAVQFWRLNLDEKVLGDLPLIPTTQHPHVFSLHEDLSKSPLLLVYDLLGRLSLVYVRDKRGWDRKDVIAEHAGKSVTQFSVRFCFSHIKDRNRFLQLMEHMVAALKDTGSVAKVEMTEAVTLLSRSRVAPVVLPVAVHKSRLKNVKL